MAEKIPDRALLRSFVRRGILKPEDIVKVLEEVGDRPLADYLRESGRVEEEEIERAVTESMGSSGAAERELVVRKIGKYDLIQELGKGGMGVVWKARDTGLDRLVALKLLKNISDRDLERFRREAKVVASFNHPNVADIYEFGSGEVPYISMELIEGKDLGGTRLPLRKALEAIRDAAEAVYHAHQRGIVHRDIKPQNLMIDSTGKIFVMDFGLARQTEEAGHTMTTSGDLVGTPMYMAPEQVRGEVHQIGTHTDVWALGATLYHVLTGYPPFQAKTYNELFQQILHDRPTPPRELIPTLERDIETILLRCLEQDPAQRYESAGVLADDLNHALRGEPIKARRVRFYQRILRRVTRRPALLAAAAFVPVIALLLIPFLGGKQTNLRDPQVIFDNAIAEGDYELAARYFDDLAFQYDDRLSLAEAVVKLKKERTEKENQRDAAELMELGRKLKGRSPEHAVALFSMAVALTPRNRAARLELAALLGPGPASDRLLGPLDGEARLELVSDPAGAEVEFQRDVTLPYVETGWIALRARHEGRVDTWFAIELMEGASVKLDLRLPEQAPPETFFLSDGHGGGVHLSLRRAGVKEPGAHRKGPPDRPGPVRVTREEAEAFAASKGGRLMTPDELTRAAKLNLEEIPADPIAPSTEWSSEDPSEDEKGRHRRDIRVAFDMR